MTMPAFDELTATLSEALKREWDEESLTALNADHDACLGLAIAHGVRHGWLATPLPDDAMACLVSAHQFVQQLDRTGDA